MKIVSSREMRSIEDTSETIGVSKDVLMENAGCSIASHIVSQLGSMKDVNVLTLIGAGGNGSDGYIVSRYLAKQGAVVTALKLANRKGTDPKEKLAKQAGVMCVGMDVWSNDRTLKSLIANTEVLIDGLLGIGVNRKIEGQLHDCLKIIKNTVSKNVPVVSIDLPSGVNADTGAVDPAAIRADLTTALGFLKIGHVVQPGASFCGEVSVMDIGIPLRLGDPIALKKITKKIASTLLPERPKFSNKGTFGKVLVVGGSKNFFGAPALASAAAARSGAGLVTVASQHKIASTILATFPEATLMDLVENSEGELDGWRSAIEVKHVLDNYSSLLIGCGLGMTREVYKLVQNLLFSNVAIPPTVIDADGLNVIAKFYEWWDRISDDVILTPHPGEMSRLTGLPINEIQSDRLQVARFYARKWRKIVVLKGACTVIASPRGEALLNDTSNPALASAGTGDVLAGIVTGLVTQGVSLLSAATLGVYVHSQVACNISERVGNSGLLASDMLYEIPSVMKTLRDP